MKNKLRLGFLTVIVLTWVICIYAVLSSMSVQGVFLELESDVVPGVMTTIGIESKILEIKERVIMYLLRGNVIRKGKTLKEWLQEEYEELGELLRKHPEGERYIGLQEREDAEEIANLCQKLTVVNNEIIELKDIGAGYEELIEKMETDFRPIFSALRGLLEEHIAAHQQKLSAAEATVHAKHDTSVRFILVVGILVTLVSVAIALIVESIFVRYITQRKKTEETLRKRTNTLDERVKELDCLYGISRLVEKENISLEEILEGTVNLIPPSWRYPEVTAARIALDDQSFQSKNFRESPYKETREIKVSGKRAGVLEVVYLEERPENDEGPFFKEERNLMSAIAQRLGRIIERKRMEIDLRIKEEAIASSVNAIVLADLEGNLSYVNHSFLHMWGYSNEKEVLGKPIADLWKTQGTALDVIEVVLSDRSWMGELVARRKDSSLFDVQILANIVENEVGKGICMMASVVDITERKKIEQMKSDFVALASHELRTPLTSIQGYTELMLDGDVGEISREQKEFLEIISQNTRRLEALINDVLDVEKIESGRMTMKREKVDLSQIVDSCVNTFKVMAEGKGLQLQKDVKTSPINVLGDSDRLSQVFSNLLSNAIKYTKEGRQLMNKFKEQVRQFPIDQEIGEEIENLDKEENIFSLFTRTGKKFRAKTVIIASGKRSRSLNVPGEKKLVGRGVSYCSICDAPFFEGKEVAVIGGGNSAFETALDLVKIASRIYLIDIASNWRADPILVEQIEKEKEKVTFFPAHKIKEIKGKDKLEGIIIESLNKKKTKNLSVQGVFIEIGLIPNSEFTKSLIKLNQIGEIIIDCSNQTNIPGLLAAGDVSSVPEKQIIIAAGEGAKATLTAHQYLMRLK